MAYGKPLSIVLTESRIALALDRAVTCIIMMFSGSLLFAYLVGSFCSIAANVSPETSRFRQDLTDLNKFLNANHIPTALRYQLREYMHHTVYLRRNAMGNRLLSALAPKLRNEVALTINAKCALGIAHMDQHARLHNTCDTNLVVSMTILPLTWLVLSGGGRSCAHQMVAMCPIVEPRRMRAGGAAGACLRAAGCDLPTW